MKTPPKKIKVVHGIKDNVFIIDDEKTNKKN
jgi:hypothetical protein